MIVTLLQLYKQPERCTGLVAIKVQALLLQASYGEMAFASYRRRCCIA
jgi:hypothetical protein